jgi:hypothetical protein
MINGMLIAGGIPQARLVGGHVMVPLGALTSRIVEQAQLAPGFIRLSRGALTCSLVPDSTTFMCGGKTYRAAVAPFRSDGTAFVPLAEIAHAFGASVEYDARSHTVALTVPLGALRSPLPFDPLAPQVAPTQVFTPQPTPAAAIPPVPSGPARPRRTAIPVNPSRFPS